MTTIPTFFHAVAVRRGWLAAMAGLMLAAAAHGAPSVYPTGVTRYDPQKAWNGYVVFSGADRKTRLIDMNGNEVRRWDYPGFPTVLLDPALAGGARGRVLVQLAATEKPHPLASPGNGLDNQAIGELDWDGKVVWRWGDAAPDGAARQHHDLRRLPNGNTLVLVNKPHPVAGFDVPVVIDDAVYEITPNGEIAWRWLASEHLEEFGFTAEQLALVRATKNPDYLHVNNLSVLGPNRWFDAGDARFHPDNLMIDARNANFIAIIARASGKVVWHLGPGLPPIDPKAGQHVPRPVDQFVGQHDAHLIPAGLPGAGNLLVFDNQGAAAAQWQHADRRGHDWPVLPGDGAGRDRLGVRQPVFRQGAARGCFEQLGLSRDTGAIRLGARRHRAQRTSGHPHAAGAGSRAAHGGTLTPGDARRNRSRPTTDSLPA